MLAPVLPFLHQVLKPVFPGCLWLGNSQRREIALTFDDGPHPEHSPDLLRVLDHYDITASFFWLGSWVEHTPTTARATVAAGHWIGLHGYDHRSFPGLSPVELRHSLERTQAAIEQVCGLSPQQVRDVRPPNGLFTPQTLKLLNQWGYRTVMWSVVPVDWERPGVEVVVERVLSQTGNGDLLVLHDGPSGGQDVAAATARLLPVLLAQGYRFVTIEQLWANRALT
ncbi:polysaccharide deacetylase family protein [Leptolyngbya sp. FACHB-261]|uniref:polysaccharide deacetylase family protein n=1 Tax=Leptolyngbya sp. FACHB-261 TaxID=2692806 RepID=UPI001F553BBD|nr:polysaccharide deacetylase family protein [Leptolyngbya sp. FACHB-261]